MARGDEQVHLLLELCEQRLDLGDVAPRAQLLAQQLARVVDAPLRPMRGGQRAAFEAAERTAAVIGARCGEVARARAGQGEGCELVVGEQLFGDPAATLATGERQAHAITGSHTPVVVRHASRARRHGAERLRDPELEPAQLEGEGSLLGTGIHPALAPQPLGQRPQLARPGRHLAPEQPLHGDEHEVTVAEPKLARPSRERDASHMDKTELVGQLLKQLETSARAALSARDAVVAEARDGATPDEKREDARAAHQAQSLGKAQQKRAQQALAMADALAGFRPGKLPPTAKIGLGALVEIEDADSGEGRTFFLAPVGAGITLAGPGGDGDLVVVTPVSPIGRAVIGRATGDIVDVTVEGECREWQITWVG